MLYNEIKISSFILKPGMKIRDLDDPNLHEYFINIEKVKELTAIKKKLDSDYLDGYISIIYSNQTIMGPRKWDLVDQLWAYILTMIKEVLINKYAETTFPDQPLKLSFTSDGDFIVVAFHNGREKYVLPKDAFFDSLLNGAHTFFTAYEGLFGSEDKVAQYQFKKIEELKKALGYE